MRHLWWTLAAGAAALVLAVPTAHATDEEIKQEIREMRDMVLQLQDQMAAQQGTIDSQQQVIQEAGLEGEGSKSALSSFLENTEFSGWVTASYTWNTKYKGDRGGLPGQNVGLSGLTMPFHPDSNTFQVDQLWFSMDKAVSEESRGGFHADILFGKTASLLGDNSGAFGLGGDNGNSGVSIFTAYASYLAPIGDGVRFDMGELPTMLGAEVVQSTGNFNITRGLVWGLQPITNTGIQMSTDVGPVSLALGAVNDFTDTNTDFNNNKAVTASIGMGDDMFSGSVNMIYGTIVNSSNSNLRGGILDMVLSADPTDNLSIWYNLDWVFTHDRLPRTDTIGQALAARLGITDDFGVSIRGEHVRLDPGPVPRSGAGSKADLWSVTTTLDYTLAEGLLSRLEFRYDGADADDFFFDAGNTSSVFFPTTRKGVEDRQFTLILDLTYMF